MTCHEHEGGFMHVCDDCH